MSKARATSLPFGVPSKLDGGLVPIRNYWLKLRRGQADIPFTDDIKLSELEAFDGDLMIIDVFERPTRCRIAIATPGLATRYGQPIEGRFADEIDPQPPLEYLVSQCSATVERRAPTLYHGSSPPAYARLILPLWGDGHINALLGAVVTR